VDSELASKLQRSKAGNDGGAVGGGARGGALLCKENDQLCGRGLLPWSAGRRGLTLSWDGAGGRDDGGESYLTPQVSVTNQRIALV
jgi:hypothetical protein